MSFATVEDIVARAGDRFLSETDQSSAKELIKDAEANLEKRFCDANKDILKVNEQLIKSIVCAMVIRCMDSFKRGEQSGFDTYSTDPFASTGFFNYRGSIEPTDKELAALGLPKRRSMIGTFDISPCL